VYSHFSLFGLSFCLIGMYYDILFGISHVMHTYGLDHSGLGYRAARREGLSCENHRIIMQMGIDNF
jgi:hypothetical protein